MVPMLQLSFLSLVACSDSTAVIPDGDTVVDCETIAEPIEASELPDDVDLDAIVAEGGTRGASGVWLDETTDDFIVEVEVLDAWQRLTYVGSECPAGLDEYWSGSASVSITSGTGWLDTSFEDSISPGPGRWSLAAQLDDERAAVVLDALDLPAGQDVSVNVVWEETDTVTGKAYLYSSGGESTGGDTGIVEDGPGRVVLTIGS